MPLPRSTRRGSVAPGRAAVIAAALVAMCAAAMPAGASTTAFVNGQSFSWVPQEISILPGDTVSWGNGDNVTHTVTQITCPRVNGTGACLFDSGPTGDVAPGTRFTFTFNTPGIYEYQCAIHIFFGTVKVLGTSDALPDLVTTALDAGSASTTAPLTLRLTATLANLSSDAGAGRSDVVFQYRSGAGAWRTIGRSLANAVPASSSTIARVLWDVTGKVGDFEIRALADGLNQVAESNEANNEYSASTSVLVPPGVVSPGIDLTEGL
jgi:plastocyanin